MYPQLLYGNPQRPYQLFGRDGFLRNIQPVTTQGLPENIALGWNLRSTLNQIRSHINEILPPDCPFIIGGGFVRDGLLGARISDIDVWLPSNVVMPPQPTAPIPIWTVPVPTWVNTHHDGEMHANNFIDHLWRFHPLYQANSVLFEAPFATLQPNEEGQAYHDMSNHWVVGTTINGYPVQFMRTNVEWENDPAEFMSRLCRNFDIDLCMMFLCVERDAESVDSALGSQYIVMPSEITDFLNEDGDPLRTMLWNTARNTTSDARKLSRYLKMTTKYHLDAAVPNTNVPELPHAMFDDVPPERLIAVPVPLRFLMDHMDRLPLPRLEVANGQAAGPVLPPQIIEPQGNTLRFNDGTTVAPTAPGAGVPPLTN